MLIYLDLYRTRAMLPIIRSLLFALKKWYVENVLYWHPLLAHFFVQKVFHIVNNTKWYGAQNFTDLWRNIFSNIFIFSIKKPTDEYYFKQINILWIINLYMRIMYMCNVQVLKVIFYDKGEILKKYRFRCSVLQYVSLVFKFLSYCLYFIKDSLITTIQWYEDMHKT